MRIWKQWQQLNPNMKAAVVASAAGLLMVAMLIYGGILATAMIAAVVFSLSGIFTLSRLPRRIRNWLIVHPLITNILATTVVGLVVGVSSVTGLMTTIMSFLMIDIAQQTMKLLRSGKNDGKNKEVQVFSYNVHAC